MAAIQFGGDGGQTYTAAVAVAKLEKAIEDIENDRQVSMVQQPLAWGTIAGAVMAFLAALFGLLASNIAGLRARRSRDQLIRSFARLRLVLPFLLATVVLGLSVATLSATLFESLSLWFWDDVSAGSMKLAGAGIVLAGLALYNAFTVILSLRQVFALFTPETLDVFGRSVGEAEAHGLWRFVRELGARQVSLLPDTIIVGLTDGFYVTEGPLRLMPEDRLLEGRTLHLPAPYLELLDTAEIAAIVGHELAHFSGDDTRYSRQFAPIYASLWRALGALTASGPGSLGIQPAVRLGFHSLGRFDTAVAHWSRLREFEADRKGSLVSGPKSAVSALIRSGIVQPTVASALAQAFADPVANAPDLVAAIAQQAARDGLADTTAHLNDRQYHPTDSHPPTIQRIEALGIALDQSILDHATRRPDLEAPSFGSKAFANWDGFCRALSSDFTSEAQGAHAQYRLTLEKAAEAVDVEEVVLFNNAKPMVWTLGISAILFAIVGVAGLVFSQALGFGHDPWAQTLISVVCSTVAVAFLSYAWVLHRDSRAPLMVLTPDHLVSYRLREPIEWASIENYAVYADHRFALCLTLDEASPLPTKLGFALYTKVHRRRRLVTLGALGIRGVKPQEFSDLIGRYVQAAHARRQLASTKTG
ncbi:MAG: M48 family metalloprotease [Pararhizobium sp.]